MVVILHPQEILTYHDNSELSISRAADRNIKDLFVELVKQLNRYIIWQVVFIYVFVVLPIYYLGSTQGLYVLLSMQRSKT